MNKSHLYLMTLFAMSAAMGVAEVLFNSQGDMLSDSSQTLWALVFMIVSIMWAQADTEICQYEKPFDFGLFMYLFWYLSLPYYLYRTRGLEGLVLYLGFMALWLGPWLTGLVAYTYVYQD